ncbi:NAD(P)/FAD-dependent oxidoreductase [Glycomyces terrestris]|uniref:NAD(P)/FAD-dependent oxidoreductase n=1 Tax=Glycomyces terrestris TaxID=2493553 RepID=A0A426UVU7_9ACTN|nr:NAD(P)/FAD-dependent oxidoreductase [Glycomyces terrestris]RRR98434.1 NAD(P)/FAD-dependent oxidoreductase [Glycomyces terrestris]
MTDELRDRYDVVVIGGGAAGLNGALMLGRARRSVAVIDAGEPRNAPADGVHGLLGREGVPPGELLAAGRAEVRAYGGHVVEGRVAKALKRDREFVVALEDGREVVARRLLVAAGVVDRLPEIPGLAERWGKDVVHCPYCHGWEHRDQAIGVIGSGPMSAHQALLFRQWTDDLVFFTHTAPELSAEDREKFAARGIRVVEGRIAAIEADGARMEDGRLVERRAFATATRMEARAGFLAGLGLEVAEHPSGAGEHVPADQFGKTAVPGVWAAGNVTDLMAQVGPAAVAGAMAGAMINADLIEAETAEAVEVHRLGA